MPAVLFIGAPAFLGLLFLLVLTRVFHALQTPDRGVQLSFWLAWCHLSLAAVFTTLPTLDAINPVSCSYAIPAARISLVFAALDGLNLLRWQVRDARKTGQIITIPRAAFVALRLAVHAALTGALVWCSLLCTV